MGCERQKDKRQIKPNWTYEGALTTDAEAIRSIRIQPGHGFVLDHAPDEGQWHVHLSYRIEAGQPFSKAHRMDLKERLRLAFGEIDRHSCAC